MRKYGEEKMELLDRLGHASSLAEVGPREPLTRIGWETIPSSAPAYDPLPRAPLDGTGSRPAEPGSAGA
jgi:RecB family exonuclease